MKRQLLAIAVLLAGLSLPSSLLAQFHTTARSFAPSHGIVAPSRSIAAASFARVRTTPAPFSGRFVRPSPRGGWHGGFAGGSQSRHHGKPGVFPSNFGSFGGGFTGSTCLADPVAAGAVFCRNSIPPQTTFGSPFFFVPTYLPYSMDYEQQVEEAPAAVPEQETALAAQVAILTDAVRQLREDQALRETSRPPVVSPQASVEEKPQPVALIYRDGHQVEVENYAVLGQTLWVFGNRTTRRVPLANLDLDATRKANEQRGIDFLAANSQ